MSKGQTDVSSKQRTLRLLLIEDDVPDAELVVATLKREGYAIHFERVDTPEDLRQRMSQGRFDLIICDHNLRSWTGMEALGILRQLGCDTPFVSVTAALGDEAAVEYVKQGATDYVLKQRLERLPAVVRRALQEKALRDEAIQLHQTILRGKREWELTFDTVPDAILVLDSEFRIQRANRAAALLAGRDFSQLIGKPCWEAIHGAQEPYVDCPYRNMLSKGTEQRADLEDPRLGRALAISVSPLRDASGALCGCIEVMHDITERKRAEAALRESESSYRALFEYATLGIFRSTRDGRLLDVNPACIAMLGYDSREELLSKNLAADIYVNAEVRERLIHEFYETGEIRAGEAQWKRKDGRSIFVRLNVRGIPNAEGKIETFETIVEDITEQRELERQIRAAQKFEAIGQLAGGIAHDFNNVLGAILGWAELTETEAPEGSKLQKGLRIIIEQARHATGLTQKLLAFSRRQMMEKRVLDLNAAVKDSLALLGTLLGSDIELCAEFAQDLRAVFADSTQVEQVLLNLCVNARDAMPQGGKLTVETSNAEIDDFYCRLHPYARPGSYVQVSVSDTGTGMDAKTLEHIFEPFFTTKNVGKGTGLGLATVYGILKQHGGFIHVYSEPGHGSTFRVYFPACAERPKPETDHGAAHAARGTETILLAEDNDDLAALAREALEGRGYRVLRACDGEEAVRLFETHRDSIALVFLDVVMPRLNGPEAYLKISALRAGVPVLFCSGHAFDAPALQSLVQNGALFLQKPYSLVTLAQKIREVLDAAAMENADARRI